MRIRTEVWLLVCLCLPSCALGAGSSFVGQWRERDVVDFHVCVEDRENGCEPSHAPVRVHVPKRSFWGVTMRMPVGVAWTSMSGDDTSVMAAGLSVEFLRGSGRFAYGVRGGLMQRGNAFPETSSVSVMATGYMGMSKRFSVYGGLGYLPISYLTIGDEYPDTLSRYRAHVGGRGLVGVQIVHAQLFSETRFVWNVEFDHARIDFGRFQFDASSLTAFIGLFL